MAYQKLYTPHTVYLAGPITIVDDLPGVGAITPGMLLDYEDNSGDLSVSVHDAAADVQTKLVALERSENNLGPDEKDYADGDIVKFGVLNAGSQFWGILPSGETIAVAQKLQSNGDGRLKAATADTATANVAHFVALEAKTTLEDTRIRVEVL